MPSGLRATVRKLQGEEPLTARRILPLLVEILHDLVYRNPRNCGILVHMVISIKLEGVLCIGGFATRSPLHEVYIGPPRLRPPRILKLPYGVMQLLYHQQNDSVVDSNVASRSTTAPTWLQEQLTQRVQVPNISGAWSQKPT